MTDISTMDDAILRDEDSLAPARLLKIVARELVETIATEIHTDRARRLLWMMDGLLRHVALRLDEGAIDPPAAMPERTGRAAAKREQHAIASVAGREGALTLPLRTAEAEAALSIDPAHLTDYLHARGLLKKEARVASVEKLLGGFSKETFLIAIDGDAALPDAVIRRDVRFGPVDSSVLDEFPLLAALHARGLDVPRPLLVEPDGAMLGAPFMLTDRARGTGFPNTEGIVARPEQVHAARELARFLAQLHAQDVATLGLGGRWGEENRTMADHVRFEIEQIEASWKTHRKSFSPIIGTALEWLRDNSPEMTGEPVRIVHGDAGLHNLLMEGERMTVMLDWELTHPGDPTEDLAYCRTWVDQVLGWDEFLAIYYAHGGAPYRAERETFYGILADLRVAVFSVRSIAHVDHSDHPELPTAFASIYYSRIFRSKIAERLFALE